MFLTCVVPHVIPEHLFVVLSVKQVQVDHVHVHSALLSEDDEGGHELLAGVVPRPGGVRALAVHQEGAVPVGAEMIITILLQSDRFQMCQEEMLIAI